MSDDLIRRSDAIKALRKLGHEVVVIDKVCSLGIAQEFIDAIRELPSADRPQGEWKPFDLTWGRSIYACSVCEEAIAVPCGWSDGKPIYDYCPMCGAKMKGADDE